MNNKNSLLLPILTVLLILLTACNGNGVFSGDDPGTDASYNNVENVKRQDLQEQSAELGSEVECANGDFASGKLIYTAINVSIVTNKTGIPLDGGFTDDAAFNFYLGEDKAEYDPGKEIGYRYPNITDENGAFVEGGYLVLVDFHVQSDDAKSYTTSDLDSEGYPMGMFDDPYLFTPAPILVDLSKLTDEYYAGAVYQYFSLKDEGHVVEFAPGHSVYCFRLEPGENIDFTLGWLVTDEQYNGLVDVSKLAIAFGSTIDGKSIATTVPLDIDLGAASA